MFLEKKREKAKRAPSPSSSDSDDVPSPFKRYEKECKSVPKDVNREAQEKADLDLVVRNIFLDLGEEEDVEEVPLVRKPRGQQSQIEATGSEPVSLAILPPEKDIGSELTATPEVAPEEVREASPEVAELRKEKGTVKTEQDPVVKGSERKKTTASKTLKVHERMNYTPERTRTTWSTTKAKESTPVAPVNPPRQTRSKRGAQTRVNTGMATPAVKKLRVTSPRSKGKGKRITEFDTAKFMEVNFSDSKGKLDNTKLKRF